MKYLLLLSLLFMMRMGDGLAQVPTITTEDGTVITTEDGQELVTHTVSVPVRISHPSFRMTNISYSKRNLWNADYTKILMYENPEMSALGETGRGLVWGTLTDLIAASGGTAAAYKAAAHVIPNSVNMKFYSAYWSPLAGETNVIYTLYKSSYSTQVAKIDLSNYPTSTDVTSFGDYDPHDGTVISDNSHIIGFTNDTPPRAAIDYADPAKYGWGAEMNLSTGAVTARAIPGPCSADGKRWPQQGTGHAARSPNKNWNATYGLGAGQVGAQDFSSGSGCDVLARSDTAYPAYPDEPPTHSSWEYSDDWFVGTTMGAYNGSQTAPYLTNDHIYKIAFNPDTAPYFTYTTLLTVSTSGFWNTPVVTPRRNCRGEIGEDWYGTACGFHTQTWTNVRKDGNQIVYWSSAGKYSYDDYRYSLYVTPSTPLTDWANEGMFLYDLSTQTPPEAATVNTSAVSNLTATSVTAGGDVVGLPAGSNVSWCGVAYGTSTNPTTPVTATASCTTTGTFSQSITGLAPCTTYYLRAGITTQISTEWGSNVQIKTVGACATGDWTAGGSTIALVTSAKDGGGEAGGATTAAINTTGATLLVVGVSTGSSGTAVVSDNKTNEWHELTSSTKGNVKTQFFYADNPTVGTGHTFNATQWTSSIFVLAFSGATATSPFDQQNGANGTGTTLATGSVTPSVNNEVLVTALGFDSDDSGSRSINSSFTVAQDLNFLTGNYYGGAIAYKIQTTAGAENPTWTRTANADSTTRIATFKATNAAYYWTSTTVAPASVKRGSTTLTLAENIGALTTDTWFWDTSTNRLYVQTDGSNPGTVTIQCDSTAVVNSVIGSMMGLW